MNPNKSNLIAIDFFCGAGGMTNGFRKAGIKIIAGIDIDGECKETYEKNNRGSNFILADIKKLSFEDFEKQTGIKKNDDNLIFIGCSPCQYWTKIKTDRTKSKGSRHLLADFQKYVEEYNPGYIVIENVPGILTKEESPLNDFLEFLKINNYSHDKAIIDAYKYGVPQTRRRFLLIASRVNKYIKLPQPTTKISTVRDFISEAKGFPELKAGTFDGTFKMHTVAGLSEINLLRLKMTKKNGGTRLSYVDDKNLAVPCQYNKKNSFHDTYGRMHWDKPAPTITTKFISISNGRFAHPEQDRAISLREGATLQTFDKSYKFYGSSIASIAKHIGNAVPPALSKKIALSIINLQDYEQ
ncbi:MAG: DNA (cytosine-5-)-methyltransferase [Candidatus Methanoperedenaceae archaeon]|nr:MAG: DNA (cytosine-5-)-methyltransferase [Candidatus Methanoperedenaceae archaeon]